MSFPIHKFTPETKVLSLFSAAFYGINDVKHLHNAGIKSVLMVDLDGEKLKKMSAMYGYEHICMDVFEFLEQNTTVFDVVISDQWTNMNEIMWQNYHKLRAIARDTVIIGIALPYHQHIVLPPGELIKRSEHMGGVYWHVL